MKFKKYVKESTTLENNLTLNEDFFNPDAPSMVRDEIDAFYAPVEKLIKEGKFDEARKELDAMEADLLELEAANAKKKFFRFPTFMIEGQKKQIAALRAKLPQNESLDDMDRRCEKCNTLLNDSGTCPKCDDGEEDMNEELTNKEKLLRAYPELDFDKQSVTEECTNEDLSVREKLKRAYPELNFDTEKVEESATCDKTEDCEPVVEELSNKEKLKRAYPELNFDADVVGESVEDDMYSDYDDEYDIEDDVEMDRRHAALYGGDRMYCDCGAKLSIDEWGSYCPRCTSKDPEEVYEESDDNMFRADDEI